MGEGSVVLYASAVIYNGQYTTYIRYIIYHEFFSFKDLYCDDCFCEEKHVFILVMMVVMGFGLELGGGNCNVEIKWKF